MSEKIERVQKCSACTIIFTAYRTGPCLLKSIKHLLGICMFLYLLRFYWNRPEPVHYADPCGIVKTVFVLLAWSSLIGEGAQAARVMRFMPCQPASLGYREQPLVGFNRGVLLPRWDSVSLIHSGEGGGSSDHVQHSFTLKKAGLSDLHFSSCWGPGTARYWKRSTTQVYNCYFDWQPSYADCLG